MILKGVNLFYPDARNWMWDYCMYLGPYTDKDGHNYDLGCYFGDSGEISAAIVCSKEPGVYLSGDITYFRSNSQFRELYQEVQNRLKSLSII